MTESNLHVNQEQGLIINESASVPKTMLMTPRTIEEAVRFAELLSNSDMVPRDFKGKAGNILAAIQMGAELGLSPMQALQNIAVVNGRPCLWGDALLALVKRSNLLEYIEETDDGNVATCRTKRRGEPIEVLRTFSMEEAEYAGLTKKESPWKAYPKRMRQMRARAFCLRDAYPDVLKGISVAEEAQDYVLIETTSQSVEDLMPKRTSQASQSSVSRPSVQSYQAPIKSTTVKDDKTPYWISDYNGTSYLWAQAGQRLLPEFLTDLGFKESKTPGKFYKSSFTEADEEALAMRCEEVFL